MTNYEGCVVSFVIGNWSFLRASTFDIRHSGPEGAGLRRVALFLLRGVGGFLHEFRHALKFLLKAGGEVGRPVLKKDDKAECEKHKQHEPEQIPDDSHAPTLTYGHPAVNDPVRGARQSLPPVLR